MDMVFFHLQGMVVEPGMCILDLWKTREWEINPGRTSRNRYPDKIRVAATQPDGLGNFAFLF